MQSDIIPVTPKNLRHFLLFPDHLYQDDPNYVPFMYRSTFKDLHRLLFVEKTYRALLAVGRDNQVAGRILLTVNTSKKLATDRCGYFFMYECVNDSEVSQALLSMSARILKDMGADYMCGPFYPFDPDNRRGILCRGFDKPPMIFTSYNPDYYPKQLSDFGLQKQIDAYEYRSDIGQIDKKRLEKLSGYVLSKGHFHIDTMDPCHIDRDIRDLHTVMEQASTQINYQDVISLDEIFGVFRHLKRFILPELVVFARRDGDGMPLGFMVSLPDYFFLIQKMHGRLTPSGLFNYLKYRSKITGSRSILQYVIPDYQSKGVLAALYYESLKAMEHLGIQTIEMGTILENNNPSNGSVKFLGAECYRTYRLYEMPLC